ncbi:hypothetical protein DM860_007558 [Cuscuta australis]|uniref:Uncharacterized protein n=1 Tax=Cuscuta australis TaxID=267555 RepID=A0A328E5K2_9ASTE|nr:hypothetical protein DM860_007558 [Cuscuta australis]
MTRTTTGTSSNRKNDAKKRDISSHGYEPSGAGGVFDFPWSRDGPTSKGYYNEGYDDEECRLEFDDLFAGLCDPGLDYSPIFIPMSDFPARQTTTTPGSNERDGGDLPNLHGKIVDQSLDGIWSSVLDHPLHDNIISL